jgi:hypothetical protein
MHPRYVKNIPQSQINHVKVLLKYGEMLLRERKQNEASQILAQATEILESKNPLHDPSSVHLRLLGKVLKLQGQTERADVLVQRELDKRQTALSKCHPFS